MPIFQDQIEQPFLPPWLRMGLFSGLEMPDGTRGPRRDPARMNLGGPTGNDVLTANVNIDDWRERDAAPRGRSDRTPPGLFAGLFNNNRDANGYTSADIQDMLRRQQEHYQNFPIAPMWRGAGGGILPGITNFGAGFMGGQTGGQQMANARENSRIVREATERASRATSFQDRINALAQGGPEQQAMALALTNQIALEQERRRVNMEEFRRLEAELDRTNPNANPPTGGQNIEGDVNAFVQGLTQHNNFTPPTAPPSDPRGYAWEQPPSNQPPPNAEALADLWRRLSEEGDYNNRTLETGALVPPPAAPPPEPPPTGLRRFFPGLDPGALVAGEQDPQNPPSPSGPAGNLPGSAMLRLDPSRIAALGNQQTQPPPGNAELPPHLAPSLMGSLTPTRQPPPSSAGPGTQAPPPPSANRDDSARRQRLIFLMMQSGAINPQMGALMLQTIRRGTDEIIAEQAAQERGKLLGQAQGQQDRMGRTAGDISRSLEDLARIPFRYGGDRGVFGSAVGPWQGDTSSWNPVGPLSRLGGYFSSFSTPTEGSGSVGRNAQPDEVRRAIEGSTNALAAIIKPLIRGPGEGSWSDADQALLSSVVGRLTMATTVEDYFRELGNVRQRIRANFGIDLPEISRPQGARVLDGQRYIQINGQWFRD